VSGTGAPRGLEPLAHVAGVLGDGDVVELGVEHVLLGEGLADAQQERHVAPRGAARRRARRFAQGEEAPAHGDGEGEDHAA
jgi:hypothetical protein